VTKKKKERDDLLRWRRLGGKARELPRPAGEFEHALGMTAMVSEESRDGLLLPEETVGKHWMTLGGAAVPVTRGPVSPSVGWYTLQEDLPEAG
jgi:hypothetical protein